MSKDKLIKASNDHWEKRYSVNVKKDTPKITGEQFDPKQSKERKKTYRPINECDY